MIKTYDGMHYDIPDEWAEKLQKYDEIVKCLEGSSPYSGNRETCNKIREIVKGEQNG